MIVRKFTDQDIECFSELSILSYTNKDGQTSEHLRIEKRHFVSCFIDIDYRYGIFIRQFRPVIQKETLEIPMGKVEPNDIDLIESIKRELEEECNLFLKQDPYIICHSKETGTKKRIFFTEYFLTQEPATFLSPGISTSQQHGFSLHLSTKSGNLLEELDNYSLTSQEKHLDIELLKLSPTLSSQLDGLSKYYLITYFYQQSIKSQ